MQEAEEPLPDLIEVAEARRRLTVRVALVALAVVFFLLGILGWLVPIVTGVPFYALGLIALGMASRRVGRWINAWERKLPYKLRRALRRMKPERPKP